ncbi:MAG TPA: hypothetical protein VGF19_15870 [Candidatus Acidoferrum sp.]
MRGCKTILDPVMLVHDFRFALERAGKSSGGPFASGSYVNGNRSLELHVRDSLGLVTYHYGDSSMTHTDYMTAVLEGTPGNKYPGFSSERLDAFRDLAFDIDNFAGAFLTGDAIEFGRHLKTSKLQQQTKGFLRLP